VLDRALTFRDARATDDTELAEVGRETFAETFGDLYPPEHLKTYLDATFSIDAMRDDLGDPQTEVRVCVSGKRIIAYCKIGPYKLPATPEPIPALELHRVYVSQARQGVGVGRILLNWAIERARQREAKSLYLGVFQGNEKAIAVYKARGFEIVGTHTFKVGDTVDDEYTMRLVL
jgi:ribosomal protein S18 acetylase RimI-like enzyme